MYGALLVVRCALFLVSWLLGVACCCLFVVSRTCRLLFVDFVCYAVFVDCGLSIVVVGVSFSFLGGV